MNSLEMAQLIVRVAKAGLIAKPVDTTPTKTFREADWDEFYELSREHGLAPLALAGLRVCKTEPPAAVASRFASYARASELRAARAADQLHEIERAFAEKDIALIALKGILFACRYYPTPGQRRFSDIDILVRADDVDRADDILGGIGYLRTDAQDADQPSDFLDELYKYHCGYERETDFPVEVHWDLVPKHSPVTLDLDGLWERSRTRNGWLSRELSPLDEIVFQAIHMARHEFHMPARSYFDLYLIFEKNPSLDPDALWQAAERCGASVELSVALGVAAEWGLIPLAPSLVDRAKETAGDAELNLGHLARYALTWPKFDYADRAIDTIAASTFAGKLRRLREVAFPQYQSLVERDDKVGSPAGQPARRSYSALWRARLVHWARKAKNLPAEMENLRMSIRMRQVFNNRTVRGDDP